MSKYLGIAYNLRLPPELKEKIQQSAKQLNRSMNADIVARLEESFEVAKSETQNNALVEKVHVLEEVNKNIMIALAWALEKKSVQNDADVEHYANKAFDVLDKYSELLKKPNK